MECLKIVVLVLVLISTANGRSKNKGRLKADNQCVLSHDGCSYEITLTGSTCLHRMQGDGPSPAERINETFKNDIESNFVEIEDSREKNKNEDDVSFKKLEGLEKKLIKMMEGLSVRSLRHIRQIRNDLRKMSQTISSLQQNPEVAGGTKGIECPADFVGVGTATSCYRFSTFATGWHDAREYCAAFGADLVAPDTLKESYILDYLIKSNPGYTIRFSWCYSQVMITQNCVRNPRVGLPQYVEVVMCT